MENTYLTQKIRNRTSRMSLQFWEKHQDKPSTSVDADTYTLASIPCLHEKRLYNLWHEKWSTGKPHRNTTYTCLRIDRLLNSSLELMLSTEWNTHKTECFDYEPIPTDIPFHPPSHMRVKSYIARETTGGFITKRKTSLHVNDGKITTCICSIIHNRLSGETSRLHVPFYYAQSINTPHQLLRATAETT